METFWMTTLTRVHQSLSATSFFPVFFLMSSNARIFVVYLEGTIQATVLCKTHFKRSWTFWNATPLFHVFLWFGVDTCWVSWEKMIFCFLFMFYSGWHPWSGVFRSNQGVIISGMPHSEGITLQIWLFFPYCTWTPSLSME